MQLKTLIRLVFTVLFALCLHDMSLAVQRFPLPQFQTGYQLPETVTPYPSCSTATENGLAVVCYLVFLATTTWLAVRVRSRRCLFLMSVASVLVLGFLFQGCPCPVGTTQNMVQSLLNSGYTIPITLVVLFFAPLIVSVFYGRTFCASVCPIGAVQELIAIKPVQIPSWLDQSLSILRYIYLGVAVMFVSTGLSYIICRFDPVVSVFRMQGLLTPLVFSAMILISGVFVGRPYCRFLCPYGVLLGWCAKLSKKHVKVTPGECTNCMMCETACPYGAIEKPTTVPDRRERKIGPVRLLILLLFAPILVGLFGLIGYHASDLFAQLHFDVRLAEMLRAEELKIVPEYRSFDETEAFYALGIPVQTQYRQATEVVKRFRVIVPVTGVWIGLVIAAKMIHFALRRRRDEYRVDPTRCVACGRCFWYCPNQKENRVFIDEEIHL